MSAPQPQATVLRLKCDCASFDAPVDLLKNSTPKFWKGSNLVFQLGLFVRAVLADVSALTSLTLEIKALSNNAPPAPSDEPLAAKTISSFDNGLTAETWAAGSAQHAIFELSNVQANLTAGELWMLIYGVNSAGARITFCAGKIQCINPGGPSVGDPPPATPTYYTAVEADARYAPISAAARVILPTNTRIRFNADGTFQLEIVESPISWVEQVILPPRTVLRFSPDGTYQLEQTV